MLNRETIGFVCIIITIFHSVRSDEVKTKLKSSEKEALEKLHPIVKEFLYRDFMAEDYYLVAFLRASNMNINEAAKRVRVAHQWRIENRIDGIVGEKMLELHKRFPYYSDGIDIDGRPVVTWDYGRWDIRKMALAGSMPQLVRYLDKILEDATTKVRDQRNVTQKDVTQYIVIIDGHGFSLRTHGCLSCFPFYYAFITHTDMYYPHSGYAVYMINVPKVFETVHNVIRPVMSPQIRDSMEIHGHNKDEWRRGFLKTIPLDQIRKQFGGTKVNIN